jgi:hypothetical protein
VLGDLAQLGCIAIGLVFEDQGPQGTGIVMPGRIDS